MKNLTLILLSLFIIATACKKKKEEPAPATTTQNNVATAIGGAWRVAFFADDDNGNFTLDESEKYPPDTLIYVIFNADGTGIITGDVNNPPSGGGLRWSIADKKLTLLGQEDDGSWNPDHTEYYYISSLTATEMLWQDEPDSAFSFMGFTR